ncbi:glycine betaine uptake BCCT transporter [Domibacillus enclensis]|uniref:Glycine betaine transporter n=1 Tax=Domibacillus enclensis TaxID=1017273 RepID=A0A1N6NA66_9BACI|nr:BCCT family transporter [Domibacillus enclensis]OXS79978.1 glycine/betaine ABC transporter permease [Domibacillus enclensis]SIP88963.1 glycine betaine transporter [Domibacillus enclensis]
MKKISSVFWWTAALVLAATIFGAAAPDSFGAMTANVQGFITSAFGWYYLILVSIVVLFCLVLVFSPIGQIRLGQPGEKPEYSTATWFAMLFSAGMGIGLVFWGAAEPLSHYAISSPLSEPGTDAALRESMRYSFFHWGLHAWAIYAVVALSLAYSQFRKGEPGLISRTLKPVLGKYAEGWLGTVIDVIAVFATVVGVATTLGFGAAQINGGLSYLFGVPVSFSVQLVIIAVVTVLFIMSALSGLGKGIKILSNTNMVLAIALLVLMLILGPTMFILNMFTDTIGSYLQNIFRMSFQVAPLDADHNSWINGWTIFYWAWWISWAPFVGVFIARVSRGRTVREFLIGVLLMPSVVSFFWFAVFGASAMNLQMEGAADLTQFATEEVLFAVFNELPWSQLLSVVAILLVSTFFITSADSATFVLGMQTTHGSLTPPNNVKVAWGIFQSLIAVVLLYSGGLQALQNAAIAAAFPFSIIMILMMVSLYKAFSLERKEMRKKDGRRPLT